MTRARCRCGQFLVNASGPINASLLLIGDFPNYENIKDGYAGSGKVGDVLRTELARIGIQMSACRVTNVWQHGVSKECDIGYHIDLVAKEIPGHDWVILMGSDATKAFVGRGIMEVAGLQVKSKLFPKIKFFAIPNPGTLLRGDIGEMRLALEKFNKLRRKK